MQNVPDGQAPEPRLLTAEEVADRLRVSLRTVRRWQYDPEVPLNPLYLPGGHSVRFQADEVAALVEGGDAA